MDFSCRRDAFLYVILRAASEKFLFPKSVSVSFLNNSSIAALSFIDSKRARKDEKKCNRQMYVPNFIPAHPWRLLSKVPKVLTFDQDGAINFNCIAYIQVQDLRTLSTVSLQQLITYIYCGSKSLLP